MALKGQHDEATTIVPSIEVANIPIMSTSIIANAITEHL